MWRELWFKMAHGITSEYERLKKVNVFEFWALYDLWVEKVTKENKMYKSKANGK